MQQKYLKAEIARIVKISLAEDCASNDVTSDLTIPKNSSITFEEIIFCGKDVIIEVFLQLKKSAKFRNSKLDLKISAKDGSAVKPGKSIAQGFGDARLIFAAERVILNLTQHLSGIATLTQKFVQTLGDKKIKILDTRKTLPSFRLLQKYSVTIGGGKNHRFSLADMILIKDNHIAAAGSIKNAIEAAKKNKKKLKIEVECDTVEQVAEAIKSKPDIIMLDNMKIPENKKSFVKSKIFDALNYVKEKKLQLKSKK